MPIIRIETNVCDLGVRAAVAAAITEEMLGLGLTRPHIATIFQTCDARELYVAETQFSEGVGPDVGFAFVRVGISSRRSTEVRTNLAQAIATAFEGAVEPFRISIDFVSREREDVYIGGVSLGRRDAPQPHEAVGDSGRRVEDPGDLGDSVRRLLTEEWDQDIILTAPATTRLADLFPLDLRSGTYDSLEVVETSLFLEESLDFLTPGDLDSGQADVAAGLGGQAMLSDLFALLGERQRHASSA